MSDSAPQSPRERAAELTRTTILDAFLALAHSSNVVTVSIPAVAREAGVSVRTVYRYFPSKDELQNAAAYRYTDIALGDNGIEDTDAHNLEQTVAKLWQTFAERLPALHAEHATPAGRKLRTERLTGARALVKRRAAHRIDDESADLVIAVTSSSMFLELVDRMGYSPEQAASMANRLAWLILDDAVPDLQSVLAEPNDLKEQSHE